MVDLSYNQNTEQEENKNRLVSIFGVITVSSLIFIIFVFIWALFIASTNNYAILEEYNISVQMISDGIVPASLLPTIENTLSQYATIETYFDKFFIMAFLIFVISSLIYSYNAIRENYFTLISLLVMGLILMIYLGGIILSIVGWFKQILIGVFPSLLTNMPFFSYYLNHAGIINAILIVVNIIFNFLDIDFSKYENKKKTNGPEEL